MDFLLTYFDITNRPTHQCYPLQLIIPYTATLAYKGSFFPQKVKNWNILPI